MRVGRPSLAVSSDIIEPLPPPRHYSADELAQVLKIERPHRTLLRYALGLLLYLPIFPALPFVALLLYFRYHTMRYRFDAQGVMMRWGILFRREIVLAYARIQDIHLTSNVVERWFGLARIQISTASGTRLRIKLVWIYDYDFNRWRALPVGINLLGLLSSLTAKRAGV